MAMRSRLSFFCFYRGGQPYATRPSRQRVEGKLALESAFPDAGAKSHCVRREFVVKAVKMGHRPSAVAHSALHAIGDLENRRAQSLRLTVAGLCALIFPICQA